MKDWCVDVVKDCDGFRGKQCEDCDFFKQCENFDDFYDKFCKDCDFLKS